MGLRVGSERAEVGVIPDDWDVTKLGDFIALQRGHDLTWRDRRAGEIPVFGAGGQNGFHDKAIARGPGVVLGRSGASFGQAYYCECDFWPHNTALYVRDFRGNDPRFVFYLLDKIDFSRYNSGGAQQSLNRNFIAPILVGVPQRQEQETIALALSDVDALLEGLEQLIVKKRDLKQAVMQQLLTGETRLPGFSKPWPVMAVREILRYERPDAYTVRSPEYLNQGSTPVLTANKSFVLGYTNENFGICSEVPAIIFDDFTTDTKYVDFDFKVKSSAIKILRAKAPETCLRYVFERMQLLSLPVAEHKRYYISEYQDIELPVPYPDEQIAIASVLTDIDAELSALKERLAKTRDLKQAMMQELLTGKIRLIAAGEAVHA